MCGVFGITESNKQFVQNMIDRSASRGPDGNDIYQDNDVTIGHNLLAIVSSPLLGKQPKENDRFVLSYNGEIYSEHGFSTDTDFLFHSLDYFGIDTTLSLIDGMFAFSLYDKLNKKIYLVRDYNGIKPLYYCIDNDKLIWASAIKSFPSDKYTLNKYMGKVYNQIGYCCGDQTIYKDIFRVTPGEIIEFDLNTKKISKRRYNKFGHIEAKDPDPDKIQTLINSAVQKHLVGIRKIGLFLSGGMDSSMIAYESRHNTDKIQTFSTEFECNDAKYNEDAFLAKRLAKDLGFIHHAIYITAKDFFENYENAVACIDEPRFAKSLPAYYLANKFISEQGFNVTLSGDGGDEIFTGYGWHTDFKDWNIGFWFRNTCFPGCFNKKFIEYFENNYSKSVKCCSSSNLNRSLLMEGYTHLCEDYLIRNDNLGMNFSIEGRFPLTDIDLKKYLLSLPFSYKKDKTFLRKIYKNKLPDYIINKSKSGWSIPIEWFDTDYFKNLLKKYNTSKIPSLKRTINSLNYNIWKSRHD